MVPVQGRRVASEIDAPAGEKPHASVGKSRVRMLCALWLCCNDNALPEESWLVPPAVRSSRRAHEKDSNLILSCFSHHLLLPPQILWIFAAQAYTATAASLAQSPNQRTLYFSRPGAVPGAHTGSESLHDLRWRPRCLPEARRSVKPFPVLPVSLS